MTCERNKEGKLATKIILTASAGIISSAVMGYGLIEKKEEVIIGAGIGLSVSAMYMLSVADRRNY
jgi:hypothetical protein